ncbi:zinc finger protein 567-like isoform X1 [Poecilia reticulata]|uniref:zinc finger protein 567-like isoform X1 n=1 Tax=Poecilia reticulata TaxID=8081 RepID=UPI0007E9849A|nr:PREDICTED: zinc finger protein 567-like isoform X1 [Poecilia reticulata]XP_017159345.1 PREDICTED: zinc finger protein 567-like isoform X1 [Poecilia reticulata]
MEDFLVKDNKKTTSPTTYLPGVSCSQLLVTTCNELNSSGAHLNVVHDESLSRAGDTKGDQLPHPEENRQLFESLPALPKKLASKRGRRTYICDQCGKTFRRKRRLTVHLRSHGVERPYSCLQCGKSFIQKGNLTVHQRIHTRESLPQA